jgi:hypothetical protein
MKTKQYEFGSFGNNNNLIQYALSIACAQDTTESGIAGMLSETRKTCETKLERRRRSGQFPMWELKWEQRGYNFCCCLFFLLVVLGFELRVL